MPIFHNITTMGRGEGLLVVALLLLRVDADVITANLLATVVNVVLDSLAASKHGEGIDVRVAGTLADELVLLLEEEERVVANGLVVDGDEGDD